MEMEKQRRSEDWQSVEGGNLRACRGCIGSSRWARWNLEGSGVGTPKALQSGMKFGSKNSREVNQKQLDSHCLQPLAQELPSPSTLKSETFIQRAPPLDSKMSRGRSERPDWKQGAIEMVRPQASVLHLLPECGWPCFLFLFSTQIGDWRINLWGKWPVQSKRTGLFSGPGRGKTILVILPQ